MFGVQNGDVRRVARWRARVGGRCCCVRLGVYHMSAVDFVVWRGENIAKGVVVVKGWQMRDDFSIGQRGGCAF